MLTWSFLCETNAKVRALAQTPPLVCSTSFLATSVASFASLLFNEHLDSSSECIPRLPKKKNGRHIFLSATSTTGPENSIYSITGTFLRRSRPRQETTPSRLHPRLCRKRSVFPLFPFSRTHEAQGEACGYPCDPLEGLPKIQDLQGLSPGHG